MSDELTIQPQVQQKQSSALPYAIGGAIVGGTVGALSPVGVTKPKYASYEDILKESEDTFKSQIEKGGDNKGVWEAAKEHAEKVKNAEAEYDKKVQEIKDANKTVAGTLPETEQAAKDLKLAQENYDKALETEKNKLSNISKGGVSRNSVPSAESLGVTMSKKDLKNYNTIRDEYLQKLQDIRSDANYKKYSQAITDVTAEYESRTGDWLQDYKTAAAKDPKMTPKKYFAENNGSGKTLIFDDVVKFYESELQKTGNYSSHKKAQKALRTRAYELAKQELTNLQTIAEASQQAAKIKIDPAQLTAASAKDVDEVMNKRASEYQKELQTVQDLSKKNKATRKALIKNLTAEYGCTEDKLENVLSKRIKIAQKYDSYIQKVEDANRGDKPLIEAYTKKRNKLVADETKTILAKFKKNFPQFAKIDAENLSDSEIATKAEEALKGKDVATKLESAKQAAEARAKELGLTAKELTDDELAKILKDKGIGTKEEFLAKTKNAAKEAIEKDLGKIKTPNKLVNGLIAGAALALVGLGIGSSMKKDQV